MKNPLPTILFALLPGYLLAGPVDINVADAETIAQELNGVGTARARAIVEYREEFGRFKNESDLMNVTGIGLHIVEVNEGNIVFGASR